MVQMTSACGVLSLLDEESELKAYALAQLNSLVDSFWPEISDQITKIEMLYEDESFKERHLAALVASKVYFHLGEFTDAVSFALASGPLFDISSTTQYTDTIIAKCIDTYIEKRLASAMVDKRLESIVDQMFDRCFKSGEHRHAIGIALESRRLDIIRKSLDSSPEPEPLLKYVLDVCMAFVQNISFRQDVLRILVDALAKMKQVDYLAMAQCYLWLHDFNAMASLLAKLADGGNDRKLLAYQIAFDIYDSATQEFLHQLLGALPASGDAAESMEVDSGVAAASSGISKVRYILTGQLTIKLHLEFLYRNNHSDLLILKNIKNALDSKNSMYYSAITFAHGFVNAGTTSDQFLRDNMDWLARASNWTKFSATAQLGVIHRGNIGNSMNLLAPYLPSDGGSVSSSVYSEGGALFALGLIHANHGGECLAYLKKQLKSQDEVVQHGACLGIGMAGMASDDHELFEDMKNVLFTDSAVAGEAAGLSMGLVMLGTGSEKAIEEMLQYAHDTQHEKIIRGLAVGIACIMYGMQEGADALIEKLLVDKDPILRYGAVYTIALAYTGSSSNKAISKLLHLAVSDVNDDVRRVAVTALGYVLVRNPKQVPRIVQLLSESYNPHVRYGSAMALGIACAGTGMPEALDLLESMTKDVSDFVRQGAFIAGSMILIQQNETSPRAQEYRKLFNTVITAKHEDSMARFGAVLGSGIIDAGGRNATINLCPNGHLRRESVIGVTLFQQFWWWYPMAHTLSLSFSPTALICLDKELRVPKFEVVSQARPSLFAYTAATKPPTTEKVEKVATAVLSTTAKAKARAKKSEMETDAVSPVEPTSPVEMAIDPEPKKKEQSSEKLGNLSRVLPAQAKFIAFGPLMMPVKKSCGAGILLVSGDSEEFVEFSAPVVESGHGAFDGEPSPPENFEYDE